MAHISNILYFLLFDKTEYILAIKEWNINKIRRMTKIRRVHVSNARKSTSKDVLTQSNDNVYWWSDMSTRELLLQ